MGPGQYRERGRDRHDEAGVGQGGDRQEGDKQDRDKRGRLEWGQGKAGRGPAPHRLPQPAWRIQGTPPPLFPPKAGPLRPFSPGFSRRRRRPDAAGARLTPGVLGALLVLGLLGLGGRCWDWRYRGYCGFGGYLERRGH